MAETDLNCIFPIRAELSDGRDRLPRFVRFLLSMNWRNGRGLKRTHRHRKATPPRHPVLPSPAPPSHSDFNSNSNFKLLHQIVRRRLYSCPEGAPESGASSRNASPEESVFDVKLLAFVLNM